LVKGSNAAKLQLERVTTGRPPLENWPVDSLKKLYVELKATTDKERATHQNEDATPTTNTKGAN